MAPAVGWPVCPPARCVLLVLAGCWAGLLAGLWLAAGWSLAGRLHALAPSHALAPTLLPPRPRPQLLSLRRHTPSSSCPPSPGTHLALPPPAAANCCLLRASPAAVPLHPRLPPPLPPPTRSLLLPPAARPVAGLSLEHRRRTGPSCALPADAAVIARGNTLHLHCPAATSIPPSVATEPVRCESPLPHLPFSIRLSASSPSFSLSSLVRPPSLITRAQTPPAPSDPTNPPGPPSAPRFSSS